MKKPINRENILRELIKKGDDSTREEFIAYAVPLIKKVFKCRKERALSTVEFFINKFGLPTINVKK